MIDPEDIDNDAALQHARLADLKLKEYETKWPALLLGLQALDSFLMMFTLVRVDRQHMYKAALVYLCFTTARYVGYTLAKRNLKLF